jgi:hypothetical protein
MRISDADRHKVAEVLREAAGEGRLGLDELDERLELAFGAKTYADLVPITADLYAIPPVLPAAAPMSTPSGLPSARHATSTAILGDCKRRGVWHVPAQHTAFTLMGSVTVDLREAVLSAQETLINASAIMGEVKIYIPAHMNAVVDGTPIMGDFGLGRDKVPADLGPDSPTILVRGVSVMGSVKVTRLPPPGTPRRILGTY